MRTMTGLLAIACLAGCATRPPPAQPVILGALQTTDDAQPQAQGFAIAGGALVAVGSRDAVQPHVGRDDAGTSVWTEDELGAMGLRPSAWAWTCTST